MKRANNTSDSKLVLKPMFATRLYKSVTEVVEKCRLRLKDWTVEDIGSNNKRVLIQFNVFPSHFKGTKSFFQSSFIVYAWFYLSFFTLEIQQEVR